MKRLKQVVLILLFLAVGVAALLYLNAFTQSGENFRYLDWASACVVSADGGETFFDPLAEPPALEEGELYRFTATLPEHGEKYLVFEVTGLSLALSPLGYPAGPCRLSGHAPQQSVLAELGQGDSVERGAAAVCLPHLLCPRGIPFLLSGARGTNAVPIRLFQRLGILVHPVAGHGVHLPGRPDPGPLHLRGKSQRAGPPDQE